MEDQQELAKKDSDINAVARTSLSSSDNADGVSRRMFIQRSAQIAAFTLFGTTCLDSLVNTIIGIVGEKKVIGEIGSAAASNVRNFVDESSSIRQKSKITPLVSCQPGGSGNSCGGTEWHCKTSHVCPGAYSCPNNGSVECSSSTGFDCDNTYSPFGCTDRVLTCQENFNCHSGQWPNRVHNCNATHFTCYDNNCQQWVTYNGFHC